MIIPDSTDISQYLVNEWKRQHPNINLRLLKTSERTKGGPGEPSLKELDRYNRGIYFISC